MEVNKQIDEFIATHPAQKMADLKTLHAMMQDILPHGKLWFDTGRNEEQKLVNNPTIGYGSYLIHYANGSNKEFFQIGVSANNTGISVFIMGLKDKTYLVNNFVPAIGKAKVTGYCIRFKQLKDINIDILENAIRYGISISGNSK